jgi:hypothetical protein
MKRELLKKENEENIFLKKILLETLEGAEAENLLKKLGKTDLLNLWGACIGALDLKFELDFWKESLNFLAISFI